MTDSAILSILRCPDTGQTVSPAPAETIAALNRQIARGTLKDRAGRLIGAKIDGALIRQDGQAVYPVREEIVALLTSEAIPLDQPG